MSQKPTPTPFFFVPHSRLERLVLLAVFCALLSFYPLLNQPWTSLHSFALPIDAHIPFAPVMVLAYLFFFFPLIIGTIGWLLFRHPTAYLRLMLAFFLGVGASYVLYMFAQSVVVRSVLEPSSVFEELVAWVYQNDARYNAFPSTHTLLTTITVLVLFPLLRRSWAKVVVVLVALSILASTLLLKQHYVLDVLAGMGIAWLAWRLSGTALRGVAQAHTGTKKRTKAARPLATVRRRTTRGAKSGRSPKRS